MFGIVIATILGLCGYVFKHQNFYECYLSSTLFLFWWAVGAGTLTFLLSKFIGSRINNLKLCGIKIPQRIVRKQEKIVFVYFFAIFSVGAAYLLHSSLGGLEGLRYWNSSRLFSGISIYCVIVFMNYVDFRKYES